MNAVNTLQSRRKVIEQQFISNLLQEAGEDILSAQNTLINRSNKNLSNISRKRSIIVTGNTMQFTHIKEQRFEDMKRLNGRPEHKAIPIHNKILYGHANQIVRGLKFGFINDIQRAIAAQLNIEL